METSVNNRCRAFTSIEQSKKLAEILPIESADMNWCNSSFHGPNYTDPWRVGLITPIEAESILKSMFNLKILTSFTEKGLVKKTIWEIIPCWSLAALLEVLDCPTLTQDKIGGWRR